MMHCVYVWWLCFAESNTWIILQVLVRKCVVYFFSSDKCIGVNDSLITSPGVQSKGGSLRRLSPESHDPWVELKKGGPARGCFTVMSWFAWVVDIGRSTFPRCMWKPLAPPSVTVGIFLPNAQWSWFFSPWQPSSLVWVREPNSWGYQPLQTPLNLGFSFF